MWNNSKSPACLILLSILAMGSCSQSPSKWSQLQQAAVERSKGPSVLIAPGDANAAKAYYKRVSAKIGLPLIENDQPSSDLNRLLIYLGYKGMLAGDFENIPSQLLMPKTASEFAALAAKINRAEFTANMKLEIFQSDNVLVSRFFAPKIVNYANTANPDQPGDPKLFNPGWRKLVILKSQTGSPADTSGIQSASILFNFVQRHEDIAKDPFDGNVSKNNQVILVPKTAGTEDSAYFAVYLEAPDYKLGLALQNVAFDLPAPKDYFVPIACAQCHGHDRGSLTPPFYTKARLNYLDTDQWHDAMNMDFQDLAATTKGVVFDGGKTVDSAPYHVAMDVVKKMNSGIRQQNVSVDETDFKAKAVEKWLQNHATQDGPVPANLRALDVSGETWDFTNANEQELVGLLDHYCFRCHSSVRYNVFDKAGVRDASPGFEFRLTRPTSNAAYMPQGRVLPQADRDRIISLAKQLFGN
jgi:hypothetical protein